MDALINKINKIQDEFRALKEHPIELPQIIVVGSQSSGKSSVLESLVQRSFLPRGTGIVTRCPLVLQLYHCPLGDKRRKLRGTDEVQEWGEFAHAENTVFQIEDIHGEIERETGRLAHGDRTISCHRINLRIYSPNVLNLTLVDLPGITKMPVGDQPKDIERQIRWLIHQYIDNPLSIILAIVTANTDMSTSESLQLAKEVDPEGRRTLAVVTKLDIMDEGTDAYDVLTGNVIAVQLGIIGVVNRTQKDIMEKKPIQNALRDEEKFLKARYPDLARKHGSPYLAQMLQKLLMEHIKTCLPGVKANVEEKIRDCSSILEVCGETILDEKNMLMKITSEFTSTFSSMLEAGWLVDISSPELVGGARIGYIFGELLKRFAAISPCQNYSLEEVVMTIRNTNGPRSALLLSEPAFEALVRPLIKKLQDPSLDCVNGVIKELQNVCKLSFPQEVTVRFPAIMPVITSVVHSVIEECSLKTMEMVKDSFYIELGHIACDHFGGIMEELVKRMSVTDDQQYDQEEENELPFKSDKYYVHKMNKRLHKSMLVKSEQITFDEGLLKMTPQDRNHVIVLGQMLDSYYKLVSEKLADTVSKTSMTYLVSKVTKTLPMRLAMELFKDDVISTLFHEDETVTVRRSENEKKLKALTASLKVLNTIASDR